MVLIDVRIPRVIQGLSLNRFSFLDISRKGACLSRVELNTVVRVETSWLTLVSSVGFKLSIDRLLFSSIKKLPSLKYFISLLNLAKSSLFYHEAKTKRADRKRR